MRFHGNLNINDANNPRTLSLSSINWVINKKESYLLYEIKYTRARKTAPSLPTVKICRRIMVMFIGGG